MNRQLDRLRRIDAACLRSIQVLDAASPDERLFHLSLAFASLIELADSVELLGRQSHWTAVPSVVRAMLETYVDLINLCEDSDYLEYLSARDVQEGQALLRALQDPKGPVTAELAGQPDIQGLLVLLEQGANESVSTVRALSVRERFERAGLVDLHQTIYRFLSSDVHGNSSALYGRHVEREGDTLFTTLHKVRPESEQAVLVGMAAEMLLESARRIHDACECAMSESLLLLMTEDSDRGA